MLVRFRRVTGLSAAFAIVFLIGTAQTQSSWTEFFDNGRGGHFYFSPSSVQRAGRTVRVKWYSSISVGDETQVYLSEIDCSRQTTRNLSVDRFNARSGSYIGTVDLGDGDDNPADSIDRGSMGDYLAQRVC